jgi:putative dimethyl sulfoxide reductase chaperone
MAKDTNDTLANAAGERGNLHGFLAAIFRGELTPDLLHRIQDADFRQALSGAGVQLDDDFLDRPEEQLLEDLAVEYAALFLGPGEHISPHESVHVEGGTGVLWGLETAAVQAFIEETGFVYDKDFTGLPDHISVELEFMGNLTALEAEAWRENDREQALRSVGLQNEFLSQHLLRWVPAFCAKVEAAAGLPFYGKFARLLADFMESERAVTEDILKPKD